MVPSSDTGKRRQHRTPRAKSTERPPSLVFKERADDVEPAWATVIENLDLRVRQSDGMSPHTRTGDSTEFHLTGLVV